MTRSGRRARGRSGRVASAKREPLSITRNDPQVGVPAPRLADHGRRALEAHHDASLAGQLYRVLAGAAADVDHALASAQLHLREHARLLLREERFGAQSVEPGDEARRPARAVDV